MITAIKRLSNTELVSLFKDVRRTFRLNEFKEYVPSDNTMDFFECNNIKFNYQSIGTIDNFCSIEILKRVADGRILLNE